MFAYLQRIGRALMLPIAVLPAAGLALRLGQADAWNIPWLAQAGGAVFDNLAILFAVGVAAGFTADVGTACVAAFVGYVMFNNTGIAFGKFIWPDDTVTWTTGVLGGIMFGIIGAELYERFHATKLPEFLAFFGGRRFVPIVTAFTAVVLGIIFGIFWHFPQIWLNQFAINIADTGAGGAAAHAFFNRLLIPLGLHHVINTVVWFQTPGDLNHFFCVGQFDPRAANASAAALACVPGQNGGQFMTGFFPIMMFGLPAAALAMTLTARKENQRAVAGIMFSAALTSFVTGVTEPIEFAFMFVAPVLYVLHAGLTAASAFITIALGMRDGFTFSAGVIDFFINRNIASNPLGILGIGVIFAVIYFVVFYVVIKALDIPTPGREPTTIEEESVSETAV